MDNSHHPICQELQKQTVDEFDPQLDFEQFFKEAKTHKTLPSEKAAKQHLGGRRKPKTSWKKCTTQWLKADKKNSTIAKEQPPAASASYTKSRTTKEGYVSSTAQQLKPPTSGPIVLGLFNFNHTKTTTDDEFQTPYVSLRRFNSSPSYGPVYLVT